MKYVFIVNPTSGNGKSLEISRQLENMCMEKGIDYDIFYTSKKMEATTYAKKYKDDEHAIIFCIGGDGTLNEVVQVLSGSKCKLEVIPSGTGNDFYKTLKLIEEKDKKIDLGHVNMDYFINTMSVGIDAMISKNVEYMKAKKFIPKNQKYNASMLYTLFNFKPYNLDVFVDSKPVATKEDKIWLLSICNGTTYGGGFKIAPNALLDDGLLDIYIVKNVKRSELPKLILKLLKEKHESCPEISHYKASKIHIQSDKEIVCDIDGETIYDKDFKVTVDQKALTLSNDKELVKKLLLK